MINVGSKSLQNIFSDEVDTKNEKKNPQHTQYKTLLERLQFGAKKPHKLFTFIKKKILVIQPKDLIKHVEDLTKQDKLQKALFYCDNPLWRSRSSNVNTLLLKRDDIFKTHK